MGKIKPPRAVEGKTHPVWDRVKEVSSKWQESIKEGWRIFQGSFTIFQESFEGVSRKFQMCFKEIWNIEFRSKAEIQLRLGWNKTPIYKSDFKLAETENLSQISAPTENFG